MEPQVPFDEWLPVSLAGQWEGAPMLGANKQIEAEDRVVENGQALTLPCPSPLHAIPGFERVSKRKIFDKGAVLFVEGHSARDVYVVGTGRLKLSMTSAEGGTG